MSILKKRSLVKTPTVVYNIQGCQDIISKRYDEITVSSRTDPLVNKSLMRFNGLKIVYYSKARQMGYKNT